MPTSYPKCSPTEMMGLLVLLNSHKGSEDVALLADDLDLEIDEILPAVEFAEVLLLVKVADGRASLTDLGGRFLAASIRDRKAILRDQLARTTLFRTLLRALEHSPNRQMTDEELGQILALAQAPVEETLQNIINWGRYAEMFRYDSESRRITFVKQPAGKSGSGGRPPAAGGTGESRGSAHPPSASGHAVAAPPRTAPAAPAPA